MKTRIVLITLLLALFTASSALARVPRKNPTELDKGIKAYDNKQYEQAIQWLDQALKQNSDNSIALAYKGASLLKLKRLNEASTTLDRAASLIDDVNTTTRAWVHGQRFFALIELGDTVNAMNEINLAIKDNDHFAPYFRNRGAIRSEQGDLEGAIADYDKALEIDPSDTQVRAMRDETAEYLKQYNEAKSSAGVQYTMRDTTYADEAVIPQFPGGDEALKRYLQKQTGYDEAKPSVRVVVNVVIDKEGQVTDAVVIKGQNKKLDKKALEICRKLPKFVPATVHGTPVRANLAIPVRFNAPKKK